MKIAIVCDRVYPYFKGGVEKRYWDLAHSLIKHGHEIEIFTGQWPDMPNAEMVIDDIKIHGVYKVKGFYINGKKSIKESIKFSIHVFPALMKADFDVIDCDQFPLLHIFTVRLAALLKRKRMIVTWSEAWGTYWIKYLGIKGVIGYLAELVVTKLPHKIISISDHTTEGLIAKTKTAGDKISTIRIGLEIEQIDKVEPSKKVSDIIFVGRLLDHKNVDVLIETVSYLKKINSNIKCLIIGNGPEKENLIKLSAERGLDNNIEFLGHVDTKEEVFALMKSSKVFVLPSTREGFGITVIEANACGLPVVAIEHIDNGAKNHITNNSNGMLSKLEAETLANNIEDVMTNRKSMISNCISYASKFNWDSIVEEILVIYFPKNNQHL